MSYHYDIAATHYFNTEAMSFLAMLLEKSLDIGIVLSSSWRTGYDLEKILKVFTLHNFSK